MEIVKPKLSIIVPVYNVRQYIDKCIMSILNQTYTDYELILVDDGSIDGSGEVCDRYAKNEDRIKVYHQDNQGQSVARNFALSIAKGDFVGFVDSDDWIEPEMFMLMMSVANEKDADIVICRLQKVSEEGNLVEILGYDKHEDMDRIHATSEILRDKKMNSFPVNKIYKKELFDGILFPVNRFFEDTATIYKVVYKANHVVTLRYIGYNYRFNPNSTCNNNQIDYSKLVKREYDNALAFGERYMFSKSDERLSEVRTVCADEAYMRMRSFIHLQVHKGIRLTTKQKVQIDTIMHSFEWKDLCNFSFLQKIDMIGYKYSKYLFFAYLKLIAIVRPLTRDL